MLNIMNDILHLCQKQTDARHVKVKKKIFVSMIWLKYISLNRQAPNSNLTDGKPRTFNLLFY